MPFIKYCFFVVAGCLCIYNGYGQTRRVAVKMVQYQAYCGGATSDQELKKSPDKAMAYANKKLIVVHDQHIDTITTDKSGYIKSTWTYGTYLLFEPWKYYKQQPNGYPANSIDRECVKQQWAKEDLKIVVSKKTITVANNIILLECPDKYPCLLNKKSKNQQ